MIAKINERYFKFVLHVNKDQNSLDLKIGNEIIEYYSFQVEPWMDPEEES